MRKLLLTTLIGVGMGIVSAQAEELVIKLRPPISIREHRSSAPSGMCGLRAITAGTGVDMYGSRDDGKFRLANTRRGSLPDGSTGTADMFLSQADGGSSAKACTVAQQ